MPSDSSSVIFLDIDGVLVTTRTFLAYKKDRTFDPIGCGILQHLCDKYDARIVIFSTWRLYDDLSGKGKTKHNNQLRENLLDSGLMKYLHTDWRTIDGFRFNGDTVRGDEIHEWLSRHPEVTKYVIVDDDSDMLEDQLEHFVHTKAVDGITYDNYHSAKTILETL